MSDNSIYRGNDLYSGRQVDSEGILLDWVYGQVVKNPLTEKAHITQFDEERSFVYEVLPETISQYTGVDYYNGQVYGGDLIQFKEKPLGIDSVHSLKVLRIFWMYHEWVMMSMDGCIFDIGLLVSNPRSFDVIGNYFDHPDLLAGFVEPVVKKRKINPTDIYARRRKEAEEGGWLSDYKKKKAGIL